MKQNQKGFSAIEAILIILVISLIGFVGWCVWHARQDSPKLLKQTTQTAVAPKSKVSTYTSGNVKLVPQTNSNQASATNNSDPSQSGKTISYTTVATNVKVVSSAPASLIDWAKNTETPIIAKLNADGLAADPAHPAEQQASITIDYVNKTGKFAHGSQSNYGDDGGNVTLALSNGAWIIVPTGQQSVPDCKYIKQYSIPKDIFLVCLDGDLHSTGTPEQLKDPNFGWFINLTE